MGQGDPGVEEEGMNEGRSLRRAFRTNEEHCERSNRRTNEGPTHERRPSTKALPANEENQRTKSFGTYEGLFRGRRLPTNEGVNEETNVSTKNLRNLSTYERRTFLNPHICITLYSVLYALLYFLCYGYTCKCIVYIILIVKRICFIIYTLSEGRS